MSLLNESVKRLTAAVQALTQAVPVKASGTGYRYRYRK